MWKTAVSWCRVIFEEDNILCLYSGGATENNGMMWVCGQNRDYDSWAADGNYGWDYKSILPIIKKVEKNLDLNKSSEYHGRNGPLTISTYKNLDPFIPTIREGWKELGYKVLSDYNAEQYNGYTEIQATVKNGERCSSYQAFLAPVKNSENLFFAKEALATQILFNQNGTTAIGVKVRTKYAACLDISFMARKEVIVSGGALGSPTLLLKSGIGKPEDLKPFNITQIKNLPVGDNYNDHQHSIHWITLNPNASFLSLFDSANATFTYLLNRTGMFSELGSIHAEAILNVTDTKAKYSDIQFSLYRAPKSPQDFVSTIGNLGYKEEYIAHLGELNKKYELLVALVIVLNPKVRGTVKLRSNDSTALPKITSNFFTNNDDINAVLAGIGKLQELLNTKAFKKTEADFIKFDIPECNPLPYKSPEYWKCFIKYFSACLWHPAGTCKMGPAADLTSVVDNELKVHGILGLRVADASIMPRVTTGNTQCPCYMIGQKAADMITDFWTKV